MIGERRLMLATAAEHPHKLQGSRRLAIAALVSFTRLLCGPSLLVCPYSADIIADLFDEAHLLLGFVRDRVDVWVLDRAAVGMRGRLHQCLAECLAFGIFQAIG